MLLFHHQPWKGLYLTYHALTTLWIRLPYWILVSLPRSWRPRRSWTLYRSVLVRFARHFIDVTDLTGDLSDIPNHLSIKPGKDVTGVWIEPANHLVTGQLKRWAEVASVASIRIPGYWMHKTGSQIPFCSEPGPEEKVIYYLHGGGYIRMSAHPNDLTAAIPRSLVQLSDSVTRVLSLEYRLASIKPQDAHPFPSQLLDAVAGYNYLVNVVGFDPKNIIVAGDSAGGNLAHALTQYLVDHQDLVDAPIPKPPSALLLICPWVDLSNSCIRDGQNRKNAASDYLKPPGASPASEYARSAFLGPHGLSLAENSHYVSPASLLPTIKPDFKNFPRTFINAGGAEVLIEVIRIYRDRIVEELEEGDGVREGDGKVRYCEMPDGIHDYVGFGWFEPERTLTLQEIKRWFDAS